MHDANSFRLYKLKEKEWLKDAERMRLGQNRKIRRWLCYQFFSLLNATGKLLVETGIVLQKRFGTLPR